MIPEQELITSEKWKRYQKNPYVRDFETTISILEGSIINSTDDLFKIWCCGGHLTREWDWHQYCPSEPCDVEQFSTDLIMQKPKIAGLKFCDLGIGTSFVQASFAAFGFQTYGLDRSQRALEHAPLYHQKVQQELGTSYMYEPITAECNVWNEDLAAFEFSDGTLMRDIDVFFCNIGDDSSIQTDLMKKLESVKPGTVWMSYYIFHTMLEGRKPRLSGTRFRPIIPTYLHSFLTAFS